MMKKLYLAGLIAIATSLWGCAINTPTVPEAITWEVLTGTELTWTELTGAQMTWAEVLTSAIEEITGAFDSWVVLVVTGSDSIDNATWPVAEVNRLIEERKKLPTDEKTLNEEDISLYEKVIDLFKSMK